MSCDVGEVTEMLENEKSQLILQPFRRFTYVTAHSPTLPTLYLRYSSFFNPSFASPTSQDLHLRHLASRPRTSETTISIYINFCILLVLWCRTKQKNHEVVTINMEISTFSKTQSYCLLRGATGEISNFNLSARLFIFNIHIPPIINTHT